MSAPAPMMADLLMTSAERDRWLQRLQAAEHAAESAGYMRGRADGYSARAAELERDWQAIARPAANGGPSWAELERKRWTLRGETRTRTTFGLPHPDDFPGRDEAT
jgi:hypothetical protein